LTTEQALVLTDREKAVNVACNLVLAGKIDSTALIPTAGDILAFYENRSAETAAPKAKAPRAPKPVATTAAPATSDAQAPATEATVATATSPSEPAAKPTAKKLTIDDIRLALTQLQTRKGSKEVPQKILESFSPTKVTGGVKEEDYAKLIAACAAA
jgi:hypothetical protein